MTSFGEDAGSRAYTNFMHAKELILGSGSGPDKKL